MYRIPHQRTPQVEYFISPPAIPAYYYLNTIRLLLLLLSVIITVVHHYHFRPPLLLLSIIVTVIRYCHCRPLLSLLSVTVSAYRRWDIQLGAVKKQFPSRNTGPARETHYLAFWTGGSLTTTWRG